MGSRCTRSLNVIFALIFLNSYTLFAESEVYVEGEIKLFSSCYTADNDEDIIDPHDAGDFYLNRGELHLGVNGYVSDNVSFSSMVHFLHEARPAFDEIEECESDSGFSSSLQREDIYVKEASFVLMDIFIDGTDLTIGRQRVRWGTSDEYNVVDNMNPVDYGNVFSFDPDYFVEHLSMDGINLEYCFPMDFALRLQAAYFLTFKPSTLPDGFYARLLGLQQQRLDDLTSGYGFAGGDVELVLNDVPEYSIDKGPTGIRLSGNAFNLDWGISWFHGFQTLPLVSKVDTTITLESTTLKSYLDYPKLDVVGLDLAGEIHSVGLWAEAAAYFPEDKKVVQATSLLSTADLVSFDMFECPYYKYTVGFDYTFGIGNGLYWNTQFNKGFYDEFAYTSEARDLLGMGGHGFMGELGDYYISFIEYSFFNEELTVTLNGILEIADYDDFSDNNAVVFKPDIEYKPFDNTSIEIGYVMITGDEATKYGSFKENDVAYCLLMTHF